MRQISERDALVRVCDRCDLIAAPDAHARCGTDPRRRMDSPRCPTRLMVITAWEEAKTLRTPLRERRRQKEGD